MKAQENSRVRGRGKNQSSIGSRSRGHARNGQRNTSVERSERESNQERERTSQNSSRGGNKNYISKKINIEYYYFHKYGHYVSEC